MDYDVDSDDEWEEEAEGESLHGSDDEKEVESEDEYEIDNGELIIYSISSTKALSVVFFCKPILPNRNETKSIHIILLLSWH